MGDDIMIFGGMNENLLQKVYFLKNERKHVEQITAFKIAIE